jgi:hypothetical protein
MPKPRNRAANRLVIRFVTARWKAGGCKLEARGVVYQLSAPAIVNDPTRQRFPLFVRMVLRLIGANDFMQRSISSAHGVSSKFA